MAATRHQQLLSLALLLLWLCLRQQRLVSASKVGEVELADQARANIGTNANQKRAYPQDLGLPSSAVATSSSNSPASETLSPVFLVATIDGQLHGLERTTGEWKWSLHAENNSFVPSPLIKTNTSNSNLAPAASAQETYILEPVSGGNIYIHQRNAGSTVKLPLTLAELVDESPFVFPASAPGTNPDHQPDDKMYVGSRSTSLVGVDLASGRLVGEFGQSNGWCEWREPGLASGESYEEEIRRRPQDLLYIGRTEYSLSILSKSTGALLQSLAYTAYHPSTMQSQHNIAAPLASPDDRYFQATHDGTLVCLKAQAGVNWVVRPFGSNPIISVFDISIDQSGPSPILYPHPSLYQAPGVPRADSILQKPTDAAYIGLLGDKVTPFAMSRAHFPFIDPRGTFQEPEEDCQGSQCLVGLQKIDAPTWHSPIMPAPTRLSIDEAPSQRHDSKGRFEATRGIHRLPGASSSTSSLPSSDPVLTLEPPPTPDSHLTAKLTSVLVVIATVVILVLRRRLNSRTDYGRSLKNAARIKIQEPPKPHDLQNNKPSPQYPAHPPAEEEAAEEETAEGPKRGKRRGKRGKRVMQQVAAGTKTAELLPTGALVAGDGVGEPAAGRVGSLVVSSDILGYGSHGTVVLQGTFQGRAVAVKRLLSHLTTLATHEVTLLQESDEHPNVIRYFAKEQHQNFLYIALERCPANLYDLIETPDKYPDLVRAFEPKTAMAQIVSGLSHLHRLKIIHRDMKPQNILIAPKQSPKGLKLRMLISDFGLCKKLDIDESSFFQTANNATGSFGYRAPEVLKGQVNPNDPSISPSVSHNTSDGAQLQQHPTSDSDLYGSTAKRKRLGRSLDLFSLGCIFYYILTRGEHPFGDRFARELNIVQDNVSLERLDGLGEESFEAQSLIRSMIAAEPADRPTAEQVSLHPFFWTPHMRLNFLCEASDRFEIMERDPPDAILVELESSATNIVGDDWFKPLDPRLVENLGKYRKYTADSVRDLLRVIRNKKHHYLDLPEPVRKSLGSPPEDFLTYFTHRFPSLFLHVWSVIAHHVAHEPQFETNYFKSAE